MSPIVPNPPMSPVLPQQDDAPTAAFAASALAPVAARHGLSQPLNVLYRGAGGPAATLAAAWNDLLDEMAAAVTTDQPHLEDVVVSVDGDDVVMTGTAVSGAQSAGKRTTVTTDKKTPKLTLAGAYVQLESALHRVA